MDEEKEIRDASVTAELKAPAEWRSAEIDKLATALAKCQSAIKNPKKSRTANAGKFSYNYADIADVIDSINAVAPKFGLSHVQVLMPNAEGRLCIFTMLMHDSGQWLRSEYKLPAAESNHDMGGNITYGRRYALAPMFGIAAEDDTDYDNRSHKQSVVDDTPPPLPRGPRKYVTPADPESEVSKKIAERDNVETVETVEAVELIELVELVEAEPPKVRGRKAKDAVVETPAVGNDGREIDYTGIDKRLVKKLKEYEKIGDPVGAFNQFVEETGALPGVPITELPTDFVDQVLDVWNEKIEPKLMGMILPF